MFCRVCRILLSISLFWNEAALAAFPSDIAACPIRASHPAEMTRSALAEQVTFIPMGPPHRSGGMRMAHVSSVVPRFASPFQSDTSHGPSLFEDAKTLERLDREKATLQITALRGITHDKGTTKMIRPERMPWHTILVDVQDLRGKTPAFAFSRNDGVLYIILDSNIEWRDHLPHEMIYEKFRKAYWIEESKPKNKPIDKSKDKCTFEREVSRMEADILASAERTEKYSSGGLLTPYDQAALKAMTIADLKRILEPARAAKRHEVLIRYAHQTIAQYSRKTAFAYEVRLLEEARRQLLGRRISRLQQKIYPLEEFALEFDISLDHLLAELESLNQNLSVPYWFELVDGGIRVEKLKGASVSDYTQKLRKGAFDFDGK